MTFEFLDYEDFFQFANGLVYGFVDHPKGDPIQCVTCVYMGDSFGAIQEGLVGLTITRVMWRDYQQILQLDFWDQISRLLFVYLMLISVVFNIDKMWRYETLQHLFDSFISQFDDGAQFTLLVDFFNNGYTQFVSLLSVPG